MTTPEQLLADAGWRRRHSVYTLWAILFGFGFISLFYAGARAKKTQWMAWGAAYGVIVIGALAIGGSLSPKDPDAPTPLGVDLVYGAWVVIWIVSAVHVFRVRKEWLRWKASAAGRPQWYETPAASANPTPAADLTGIGLDDPTSDYLAPAPPASVVTPATLPPPATGPRRRLPPPPTSPPSRSADRPLPPPPSAPSRPPAPEAGPELIDLNTATVDEIASLPGVGVAAAHRIIEERNRRGGFESVDEAAVAAKLQPHVRSRLQQGAVVSERQQPRRRGTAGRIVDI